MMKKNRFISMAMVVILTITLMPTIPTVAASSTTTPTAPEGYTLSYIGRYTKVTPISDDMIAVMNGTDDKGKWGFVNAITGQEIVPPKYDAATTTSSRNAPSSEDGKTLRYFDGIARILTNKGYLAIDKKGKEIVPLGKYEEISNFHNGLAWVWVNDKGWGIIDKTGREIVAPGTYAIQGSYLWETFDEGLIPVSKRDTKLGEAKYNYFVDGYIDVTGNAVIPFGKYSITNRFSEGLACVSVGLYPSKQFKRFFIDKTGKKVFDLKNQGDYLGFSNGLCVYSTYDEKTKTNYYGVIDRTGKEVLKPQKKYYAMFWYENGYLVARSGPNEFDKKTNKSLQKYHIIDKEGKLIISTKKPGEYYRDASNGLVAKYTDTVLEQRIHGFIFYGKRNYDVYNLSTGKSIIPDGYSVKLSGGSSYENDNFYQGGDFPDGMVKVYTSDGTYAYQGFINASGEEIVPLGKYADMGFFSEGKCWVKSLDTLSSGYIDTKGKEMIKPQFDQATSFINGKAVVGMYVGEGKASKGIDAAPLFDWYVLSAIPNPAVDKYTVKFDTLGGTIISSLTNVKSGLITKPDTPVRKGYGFMGWYKDKKCTKEWDFTTDKIKVNTTLYAKWKKI